MVTTVNAQVMNAGEPAKERMLPEHFCMWLQGFVELTGGKMPTPEQWKMICEHLQQVFVKVTPPLGGSGGGSLFPEGSLFVPPSWPGTTVCSGTVDAGATTVTCAEEPDKKWRRRTSSSFPTSIPFIC